MKILKSLFYLYSQRKIPTFKKIVGSTLNLIEIEIDKFNYTVIKIHMACNILIVSINKIILLLPLIIVYNFLTSALRYGI